MLKEYVYHSLIISYTFYASGLSIDTTLSKTSSKTIYPAYQSVIQHLSIKNNIPELSSTFTYKKRPFIVIFVPATEYSHTLSDDFTHYIQFLSQLNFQEKEKNLLIFVMNPLQEKTKTIISQTSFTNLKKKYSQTLAGFIEWIRQDRAYKHSTIVVIGDKGGNHIIHQATHLPILSKPIDTIIELYPTLSSQLTTQEVYPDKNKYSQCFLIYSDHIIKPNLKVASELHMQSPCRTILPLLDNKQISHDEFFTDSRWPHSLYSMCQLASSEYPYFKYSIYYASSYPHTSNTLILKNDHPFSTSSYTFSQEAQKQKSVTKEKELETHLEVPIHKTLSYSEKNKNIYTSIESQ